LQRDRLRQIQTLVMDGDYNAALAVAEEQVSDGAQGNRPQHG
jgi:cobalamin-dependent methionine synthase I